MQSDILLQTLTDQAHNALGQVDEFKKLDTATLTWRENPTSWNVLECLQHLNLYGDFYLPAMDAKIKASHTKPEREFKPGLLGDYFAKSMLPGQKMKKMKTFADKNPLNSNPGRDVIDKFIFQQKELLELLKMSENVSLNKVKVPTSISRLIRLKLGDTFRFYTNHIIRHLDQADRILKNSKFQAPNSKV
jgi:hypothetical protein